MSFQKAAPSRLPLSPGRSDSETGEEHRPRTSPQPPRAPATVRASTSQDNRGHRQTPQGHRENGRLYIISHREAPARPGDGAAGPLPLVPALGGAEAGRRALTGAPSAALSRGWGMEGGLPVPDAAAGGRAMRAQPGRAGSRAAGPCQRPARPSRLRPGPPRRAPAPRLTCVALWNCFFSPATDMVLEGARAATGAGAGRRRRRSGAAGPSGAARSRPPLVVQPRGCGRWGAERRGTRARAERHTDVRGG